jgi:L-2-hydroxyglutarate oxidase LhgO
MGIYDYDEWVEQDVEQRRDLLVGYKVLRTTKLESIKLGVDTFLQALSNTQDEHSTKVLIIGAPLEKW